LPLSSHGFISGMCSDGLWICVNEMARLNATNTLYVVRFRDDLSVNERYACALTLLTTTVSSRLRRLRRRYADGLQKIEPGQLADVNIPSFQHIFMPKNKYSKAHSCL